MRSISAWTAGGVGAVAGLGLATVAPPALSLAAGALLAIVAMQFVDGWPQYGLAGTVYLFTTGLGILVPNIGDGYGQTALVALFAFGVLSALKVAVDEAIDRGIDRVTSRVEGRVGSDDDTATELDTALSAGAGVVEIAWTVLGVSANVLRYAVFAGAGMVGIVLNSLGIRLFVPLVVVDYRIDVVMPVVVASVITGFYACGFVVELWHMVKTSVDESRELTGQFGDGRDSQRPSATGAGEPTLPDASDPGTTDDVEGTDGQNSDSTSAVTDEPAEQ